MATARAPKQWSLTKQETITTFEAWRQNLQYILSLDKNFAPFLVDGFTWGKKSITVPLRGLHDDDDHIPEASRRTAAQKCAHLELLLGQIANYCPIISRNTFVKNSTSINGIWQSIRQHFGFQTSGAHFLDLNNIRLELDERPEDLFQRLTSFVEDNLLRVDGSVRHHGEIPDVDEEMSPSLENLVVLMWLRLIHTDLPGLVKQRYGTELRSQTLASLKPEISQALDSLLEELNSTAEARVMRTAFDKAKTASRARREPVKKLKVCILCKQANRPYQHFLSRCTFSPQEDRLFMSRSRHITSVMIQSEDEEEEEYTSPSNDVSADSVVHSSRRVVTKQSPTLRVFHKHHPLVLTLDTGAEISMIKASVAHMIGAKVNKSNQTALQADGVTPLEIRGETHLTLSRDKYTLKLEALVVSDLDVDILAGIPFMTVNDISVRPAKHQIIMGGSYSVTYGPTAPDVPEHRVRRTQAYVLRADRVSTVVWPGSFIEVDTPPELKDTTLAVEPRSENGKSSESWIHPHVTESIGSKVRIVNASNEPQQVKRFEHVCQVRLTADNPSPVSEFHVPDREAKVSLTGKDHSSLYSSAVSLDPDNMLPSTIRKQFRDTLQAYDEVFSPNYKGYNGAVGHFESAVNMGPVQPPQRKGRVPQYAKDKLSELQDRFDELEEKGVFRKPEEVGVNVEYLNPSFLVKKPSGGYRLVTAFTDVAKYSKPQPSLMPDVDATLRNIAQWKYIIVTDLTSAFYQIPLSKDSMKYCGVVTPYRGVRVYTRCAMGMPGSETALEELMCRVLGDLVQEGCVSKLADDLYCGGNTPTELLSNWTRVLKALHQAGLCLSPHKTVICPKSTTILGWVWSGGSISASPHRISVLSTCHVPDTVRGLRSFIGAYKVLGRVVPKCSQYISPLEDAIAGLESRDPVEWTDPLRQSFSSAQKALSNNKTILLPGRQDQLWIVTDASVTKHGIGATLYVRRESQLHLAGFFSAKLRKHQVTWLPCEVEALSIAAAVKHFSPFIIQSNFNAHVLTDSKPCVQAIDKLCRGEFSASPRVTSFLSTISRYQVNVRHLAGSANIPTDFASRNAPECNEPKCQVCAFIVETEDSVVRATRVADVYNDLKRIPFTTRSAWLDVQSECPDLRRTHAHLKQGTRPSKKMTNVKDIKRYLGMASIAKDGLLVVRKQDPLSAPTEMIIVPRMALDGLLTALHIKLDHPSRHQLELVFRRNFYALDMTKAMDRISESCHVCASLKKVPNSLIEHSSEDPPETVGSTFAADVLKSNRQLILVVRESVTSFTTACIIETEKHTSLRDGLIQLLVGIYPLDGPPAVIRVDPAPGFCTLRDDEILRRYNIIIDIGRTKNVNKNPVAEKAIAELEDEILRQNPNGGPVSMLTLSVAVARLNSRLRVTGLSARELFTQRDQFTNEQLPLNDRDVILSKHQQRTENHPYSMKSKLRSKVIRKRPNVKTGDLVYLYSDKNKSQARSRYLVVSIDNEWCYIKRFTGNQLRSNSYKVKLDECFLVPLDAGLVDKRDIPHSPSQDEEEEEVNEMQMTNEAHKTESSYKDNSPSIPDNGVDLPINVDNTNIDMSPECVVASDINGGAFCESPVTPPEIIGSSRPRRTRDPPKYLRDYVCD